MKDNFYLADYEALQLINFGSGTVRVGPGARLAAGKEAGKVGRRALVVAGSTAWSKTGKDIGMSLKKEGIAFEVHSFSGYCSANNVEAILVHLKAFKADVLIGVGGGKCMDASKSAADGGGVPCVLVPTSAATCASDVRLCVWYDDHGACVPGMFAKQAAQAVLIDTQTIICHCPPRLFAAGMADALAKYPEIDFTYQQTAPEKRTALMETARAVAVNNFQYITANGKAALDDVEKQKDTLAAQNMVHSTIVLTALASALMSGLSQLAIAHAFHDAVVSQFYDVRTTLLHGEIVACGVLMQMRSNGYSQQEIAATRAFLQAIGVPVKLSELGIVPNEENRKTILDYMHAHKYDEAALFSRVLEGYREIES